MRIRSVLLLSSVFINTHTYGNGLIDFQKNFDLNIKLMRSLKDNLADCARNLVEIQDDLGFAGRGLSTELAQFKQKKQIIIEKIDKLDQSKVAVQAFREKIEKMRMPGSTDLEPQPGRHAGKSSPNAAWPVTRRQSSRCQPRVRSTSRPPSTRIKVGTISMFNRNERSRLRS